MEHPSLRIPRPDFHIRIANEFDTNRPPLLGPGVGGGGRGWGCWSWAAALNLLIAMMGKTFQDSHEDTHCTWIFPFAKQVSGSEAAAASKGWGGTE